MRGFILFIALTGISLTAACGHKKIQYSENDAVGSSESDGKGVKAQVLWMKPKGEKLDVKMVITNAYGHAISFKQVSMKLVLNGETATQKKNDFSGEMAPGATETGLISYQFGGKVGKAGKVSLTIDPIYQGEFTAGKADAKAKLAPVKLELPFSG